MRLESYFSLITSMGCSCNSCFDTSENTLNRGLWRLRLNWVFLSILGGLYAISYTSISSSFHQFVTNPSANDLNGTNSMMESGLGQTESFYSLVISLFNIGALVGAMVCGFLVKCIPYWHLILFSLFTHTMGYILYAITYIGWLIMISKFLSGFFIGAELTLALSYFAESSIEYDRLRSKMGCKVESSSNLRNMLFALHNIGINIGYIFGPGFAVILAQFKFDQFRSIAWYNVALGIACMVLLLVMFHGESSFKKKSLELNRCCTKLSREDLKVKPSDGLILVFLIILRGVLSFRFGAYETVYNPVLADYFGFNERDSSYYFFGLTIAQIGGTVLLIVLQKMKLSSQSIAVIGLLLTISSCIIMADWQAIPYDQCTENSPFHHPELSGQLLPQSHRLLNRRNVCHRSHFIADSLQEFELNLQSTLVLSSGHTQDTPLTDKKQFSCHPSDVCNTRCRKLLICLRFYAYLDQHGCMKHLESVRPYSSTHSIMKNSSFLCSDKTSTFSFCVIVNEMIQNMSELAVVQILQHLETRVYNTAMENCLFTNTTSDDCYWNPNSYITRKHCEDCQPICRSRAHSLTFAQFVVGSALLMVSIPVGWVPVAALISNRVSTAAQGIVMGFMVALTAVGRSVSPIWLDAAYEGMEKRTFLAMILLAATHFPFLVGLLLLYKPLQAEQASDTHYSRLNSDQSDNE